MKTEAEKLIDSVTEALPPASPRLTKAVKACQDAFNSKFGRSSANNIAYNLETLVDDSVSEVIKHFEKVAEYMTEE